MHTLNTLEGASRVLLQGFRGQRVWLAPPVDVTGPRLPSAPDEDFLGLLITFWLLQAQQFWGRDPHYLVVPGGPRSLGLIWGFRPAIVLGNFSEERGKQEVMSPSRTRLGLRRPCRLLGVLTRRLSEIAGAG